jgi:GNAT superfamily N-acetyltransferase
MPEYRGKGVGFTFWEQGIFPWCRSNGFSHLGATPMAHNLGAIGFYERLGFHISGYHRKIIKWDKNYLDAVEIEMIL